MPQPTQAEIAARAYKIWEQEGRPHGRDFEHWLEAEREISGTVAPPRNPEPAPARQAAQRRLSAAAMARPRRTRKAAPPAN
jgi:hypothetical protein